jgi:hypothetical protein
MWGGNSWRSQNLMQQFVAIRWEDEARRVAAQPL